jgi:Txe/YoeB family toxin of Txe-Axe toxin-antitoxin module
MNLQAEKINIIQQLINIQDINIIEKINELLSKSYKDNVEPMTLDKFFAKIEESEQAYLKGDIISHNDLKNEIKKIYDYLSKFSLVVAERQINKIIDRIDLLEKGYTKTGQIEPLLRNRKDKYRYLVQDNYKIIYKEISNEVILIPFSIQDKTQ